MAKPASPEERMKLRADYIYGGFTLNGAAQRHGVTHTTASRWKAQAKARGDDWDAEKYAALLTANGRRETGKRLLELHVRSYEKALGEIDADTQLNPLQKAQALCSLNDSLSKLTASVRRIDPEIGVLQQAREVVQHLAQFVATRYPQHAAALLEVLEPFGQYLDDEVYA